MKHALYFLLVAYLKAPGSDRFPANFGCQTLTLMADLNLVLKLIMLIVDLNCLIDKLT